MHSIVKLRHTLAAGAIALGAGLPSLVLAQSAPGADAGGTANTDQRMQDLARKLEQSLKMIEDLNRKVEKLEAANAAIAANAAPPAQAAQAPLAASAPAPAAAMPPTASAGGDTAAASRVDGLENQVRQLSQSLSRINTDTGVPLHGFATIEGRFYNHTDPASSNNGNGFVEKQIDFYLAPDMGDRVKTLMELAIETGEYTQSVNIDMERLQIGYVASDALTVWTGRFHTPYGIWNTAFHHGAQIQTSLTRPKFLNFEDTYGFMPAHTVGLWATGRSLAGEGHATYDFAAGNSARILTNGGAMGTGQVDMNLLGSNNHSASVMTNLGYEFGGSLDGLKLGVDAMRWRTTDDVVPVANTTQMGFAGAYGAYQADDWEVLSEYYAFHDTNVIAGSPSHSSWAGYFQAGRAFGALTPYARWESAHLNPADNYFAALMPAIGASYTRDVAGLRYDLTRATALKLEGSTTSYRGGGLSGYRELALQVAVRF